MKKFCFFTVLFLSLVFCNAVFAGEIHYAIRNDDLSRIRELIIERPKILNFSDPYSSIKLPLIFAIEKGKPGAVKVIVETAREVNVDILKDPNYLCRAAELGREKIVGLLIEKGAGVNVRGSDGYSPLHRACMNNHYSTAKLLIEKGAPVNAPHRFRRFTPLHFAVNGKFSENYLKDQSYYVVNTRIHKEIKTVTSENDERAKLFLLLTSRGANPNIGDFLGNTPLHLAAKKGSSELVRVLVQNGANPNLLNNRKMSPLSYALYQNMKDSPCGGSGAVPEDAFVYLVEKGTKLFTEDNNGKPPLYYAAEFGAEKTVKLILSKGSSYYYKSPGGIEALALAGILENDLDKVKSIVKKYPSFKYYKGTTGYNLLYYSIKEGRFEITRYLVDSVYGIKTAKVETAPLHFAARFGCLKTIGFLMDRGADPMTGADCTGYTPMEVAAIYNHLDVIKELEARGVPLGKNERRSHIPIFYAAREDNVEILKYLLSRGVNPNVKDMNGAKILDTAVEGNCVRSVKILLNTGLKEEDSHLFDKIINKVNSPEMIEALVAEGFDFKKDCNYNEVYIPFLYRFGKLDKNGLALAKAFIENGYDVTKGRYSFELPPGRALRSGDNALFKLMMSHFPDKFFRKNADSFLYIALNSDNYEIFKLLMEKGAGLESPKANRTILFSIAGDNSYDTVKLAIDSGVDVNYKNDSGFNALHEVVWGNINKGKRNWKSLDVPRLLIDRGAEVDLFVAAAGGEFERIRSAVEKDPSVVLRKDTFDKSLFDFALLGGQDKTALFLLKEMEKNRSLPLNYRKLAKKAVENDCVDLAVYLINKTGPLENFDKEGNTYLHLASENGSIKLAEKLMDQGYAPNVRNRSGRTPIFNAAEKFKIDVIKLLAARGAEVNVRDQRGYSPLMSVELLYDQRAGWRKRKLRTAFQLIKLGADPNGMTWLFASAITERDFDTVNALLEKGFDLNAPVPWIKINHRFWGYRDKNLLNLAVELNDPETVKLLINAGADVNKKDKWGWTPLALAKANGYSDVAEILVKKGAGE